MVNLFGAGFVGSQYAQLYPCQVNARNDLVPKSNNILYLISTTDNYNVKTNPYIDIETNLTTLIRVLENSRNISNVTFNFASSWFVYGNAATLPVDETAPCDPRGFYSITKRTAEQLLISYCSTYGINYRILRFANVIGPGDRHVSAKKNALTYLLRRLKDNIDIDLYNNGEFYRDYINVIDVCAAVDLVLTQGAVNEIYNIGTGKPTKFKDAIDYIVRKTDSRSKINNVEPSEFHQIVQTPSFYMNCDKLKNLGFKEKYDIYASIDQLLDEYH